MLNIFVLDCSAEARSKLLSQVTDLLEIEGHDRLLLPRVNVKAGSKNDLKFQAAPEIVIIGEQIASQELSEIASIRKLLPDCAILVKIGGSLHSLSTIDQIARLGGDDTFSDETTGFEFVRKLIMLSRKSKKEKGGKLILFDSGKGGSGVTSLVASLGELLAESGKSGVLIDLDFETQDLARFLQARPFINENLQLLLEQNRPICEESARHCMVPVWEDTSLYCVAPPALSDAAFDPRSTYPRSLLAVLEVLDELFDFIIVDSGSASLSLLRPLYRLADSVVLVVQPDPASIYSSIESVSRARSFMAAGSQLLLVENFLTRHALSSSILRTEISRASRADSFSWLETSLPFCGSSQRWPGSGSTMFSLGSKQMKQAVSQLGPALNLIEADDSPAKLHSRLAGKLHSLVTRLGREAAIGEREPSPTIEQAERLELPAPEDLVSEPVFGGRSDYEEDLFSAEDSNHQAGLKRELVS